MTIGRQRAHIKAERTRLRLALLLSLLVHALLLRLTFGDGGWLPGFAFAWQERRLESPDLRVVIVSPPVRVEEPVVTPIAEPLPPIERHAAPRAPAATPRAEA